MSTQSSEMSEQARFVGNDRLLFGIIFGMLAFWLFAQTTLNISPVMASDLGIETSVMNIAVSITALFSGIFIVVIGRLADRRGRVKAVQLGFVLSIIGSLLVGLAPPGRLASIFLMVGRQDNLAVREAAFLALAIHLLMVVAAIASIMLTIPGRKAGKLELPELEPRKA